MTNAVIELDQVSLGWRGRVAVRDVSGQFLPGSMTAIVGPNGAGKSTLIKGMMGLLAPLRGYIRLAPDVRNGVACLPQVGDLDRSFPVSVYDLVGMGGWSRTGAWRGLGASEHERIVQALDAVGLADFSRRSIGTLSGGQLQRALFARLLMSDAKVLLLDEPFAAVDQATTEELMQLLCRLNQEGRTIAVVLHDLQLAQQYFPQTLLLAGQAIAWGASSDVLTPENLHLARHLCAGDFL